MHVSIIAIFLHKEAIGHQISNDKEKYLMMQILTPSFFLLIKAFFNKQHFEQSKYNKNLIIAAYSQYTNGFVCIIIKYMQISDFRMIAFRLWSLFKFLIMRFFLKFSF